jgi:pSer/pThr/pTyr-binding forkhead associated (FHA) protein
MKSFTVGRARVCDIVIADETVSRTHARLTDHQDGTCKFADCNSSGGSYLFDGNRYVRLEKAVISLDDQICLGQFRTTPRRLLDVVAKNSPNARVIGLDPSSADYRVEVVEAPDRGIKKGGRVTRDPKTGRIVSDD